MKTTQKALVLVMTVVFLAAGISQASNIGPDSFGYHATDDVEYAWQDISLTGTRTLYEVDDFTTSADIGFTFSFYGNDYTQANWSPNGLITFGGSSSRFTNSSLATSDEPSNLTGIAVLWADWISNSISSGVYHETRGDAGNRQFILQWEDLDGFASTPSNVTFQAILYESTGDILMQYQDLYSDSGRDYGGQGTVGIRNVDGQLNGEHLQWSYNQPVLSNYDAILYSVPEPAALSLLVCGGAAALFRRRRRS